MIEAGTDLKNRLLKTEIDAESLCEVLLSHYNRSSGDADELRFGDQENPSIIIHWNMQGTIKNIMVARELSEDEVADIETAIQVVLEPSEKQYRRFPIFSNRPISGAIGFEDWFQIIPAPSSAPQPTRGWGDYVAVLEVCVEGSSLPMLVGRRAFQQARIIELLLAGLTVGGFRLQSQISQSLWVIDFADQSCPKHLQRGYAADDVAGTIPEFTDIGALGDIELVDVNGYYDGRSQGASDNTILPSTFPNLAIKFRSLDTKQQRKFLRSAYWLKHMNDVWSMSKSAAYIAAVSAIEALFPSETDKSIPCTACGLTKREGPTQKFANFVETMVRDSVPRKQRLEFYGRRSRLVHGQLIAKNDDFDLQSIDPVRMREDGEQRWMTTITRIVLHNWLVDQNIPSTSK